MSDRKMCLYCAKWFPEEEMREIKKNPYCNRCYPEVYENVKNLPWNKNKPLAISTQQGAYFM